MPFLHVMSYALEGCANRSLRGEGCAYRFFEPDQVIHCDSVPEAAALRRDEDAVHDEVLIYQSLHQLT